MNRETQRNSLDVIQEQIIGCKLCPRLVVWRDQVAQERVRRYKSWDYWGKAVPSFGDEKARLLIVGLAPAAHGGNRTGRMFTGDNSGCWLYRALYKFGFANQPFSISRDDGLKLRDCYITAALRCAPPLNRPTPIELHNCQPYLIREIELLANIQVIVALGGVALDQLARILKELEVIPNSMRLKFAHGAEWRIKERLWLIASFHPSQQNTFTKRLTEPMFDSIFQRACELIIPSPLFKKVSGNKHLAG